MACWRSKLAFGAAVSLLGLGIVLAGWALVGSVGQSLWLDELHTAWVAAGPLEEVLPRAALGNQLPLYFWWQWWLSQAVGQSELVLRATSLLAWAAGLSLAGGLMLRGIERSGQWFLLVLLALMALDQHQLFYASEARPYACLALINLAAWRCLAGLIQPAAPAEGPRFPAFRTGCWLALNGLAFWIQPVIGLSWAAQLAALGIVGLVTRQWRFLQLLIAGIVGWMLVSLPAWWVLERTWETRTAWAAFAADTRLANVLSQLPLVPIVVPVIVLASLRVAMEQGRGGSDKNRQARADGWLAGSWLWLVGWAVPGLLALGLTLTGVAPLVHPRYLFASSPLLFVWAASSMRPWSSHWGWAAVLVMGGLMFVQQGTAGWWLSGQLPGLIRGEDWRAVRETLGRADEAEPLVFCVSSLIEGQAASGENRLLSGSMQAAYMALPLESLYRPRPPARVEPLLNDPAGWSARIESVAAGRRGWWLAVRCSRAGLRRRLEVAGLEPHTTYDFGGVQLVRFQE